MNQIILASGSEGRKELFQEHFEANFTIKISHAPEEDLNNLPPKKMAQQLALRKCQVIAQNHHDDLVCAFDTTVVCDDKSLGKPKNIDEAYQMLSFLNQKIQTVMTGYALQYKGIQKYGVEISELKFSLSDQEIKTYIDTHPVTKFAGSYAIQKDDSNIFILSGTRDTIIGAPMKQVLDIIKEINLKY